MKLSELKTKIDSFFERNSQSDLDVVLVLKSPSIGGSATVEIDCVNFGFDWDMGLLLLKTKQPVVLKTNKEEAFDAAQELLMELATKPGKRAAYREEAQEILKHSGYTEEQFLKYRKFFHGEEKV